MFMKKLLIIIVLLVTGVAVWWQSQYSEASFRYKMTVTVETPEGIKTGSAVREISMVSRQPLLGESNDTHVKLEKGEAVVVDLEERGVLFALLQGNGIDAIQIFFRAFPSPCKEGAISRCGLRYYSSLGVGKKTKLASRDYPMFVTFENLSDPKSVKSVLEIKTCTDIETGIPDSSRCIEKDRFEELFGRNVQLQSVEIEITDESATWKVERWLKWLPEKKGVSGVIGSTKDKVSYKGSLGLTGIEFSKGRLW